MKQNNRTQKKALQDLERQADSMDIDDDLEITDGNTSAKTSNSAYRTCVSDAQRDIMLAKEKDSTYTTIFNRLMADATAAWNAELDRPYTHDVSGECNGRAYTCKSGQTRRQCEPQLCHSIGAPNEIQIGFDARAEYVETKCAQYK